jgi:hypothetical protein
MSFEDLDLMHAKIWANLVQVLKHNLFENISPLCFQIENINLK